MICESIYYLKMAAMTTVFHCLAGRRRYKHWWVTNIKLFARCRWGTE